MVPSTAVVVTFASQKGGVGKSTLARALAVVAARAGLEITIADLDSQQATIVEWMKTRIENKIARKIVVESFDTVEEALEESYNCKLLILDMPARANRETLKAAQHSHLIVQPSAGSLDDLRPAVLLFHELKRVGIPVDRLVIALSRTLNRNEEIAARAYLEGAGYAVLPGAIREHAAYRDAQNKGRALNETPAKDLNAEVDGMLTELMRLAVNKAIGRGVAVVANRKDGGGAA